MGKICIDMIPPLISNLKCPIIYWYQNDAEIVMRVLLHDVEDYFLQVKTDEFEFSTTHDNIDYHVYLHLFGGIIAEETSHVTTGREVTIHLSKAHKWTAWPRLICSPVKSPQIFFDLDRRDTIKPKPQPFAWDENGFANHRKNYFGQIKPDVPSSGEENDSADEMCDGLFDY